jgi:hypothetical protein
MVIITDGTGSCKSNYDDHDNSSDMLFSLNFALKWTLLPLKGNDSYKHKKNCIILEIKLEMSKRSKGLLYYEK